MREIIASTTLEEVGWESSVLLANPVADSILSDKRMLPLGAASEARVAACTPVVTSLVG